MGKTKFLLTHRSAVNRLECENGGAPMTEEGKEGEEREREGERKRGESIKRVVLCRTADSWVQLGSEVMIGNKKNKSSVGC